MQFFTRLLLNVIIRSYLLRCKRGDCSQQDNMCNMDNMGNDDNQENNNHSNHINLIIIIVQTI